MTTGTTTIIQDRFALKERLFSEGNQAAYVARDKRRNEDVLLFLVPPSSKLAENVDRAVRADIERAFGVESPALLPLLDLSEAGDYRFLVMPMPRGKNAWTRITKEKAAGKRIEPAQAMRAADDLIAAARAAEDQGTILGFSPKQVWIDADGNARVQYYWLERVYLHDDEFGLPEQAGIKTMSAEAGYFQAPELSAGRSGAAAPADQFFIGAILYGLLTGEVPGGTLAPIRRSRHDVPKPFAKAVERALAQDPAARHPDFESFRKALYKEPAKLGHLIPLLLLLLGLWAGFALFLGGADIDDWAFPAEQEARREAAFRASLPTAEPVPVLSEDDRGGLRGVYESAATERGPPEYELRLGGDGSFLLTDRSRDQERRAQGVWWREAGGNALVLVQVGAHAKKGTPIQAEPVDGVMVLRVGEGEERKLAKVGWIGKTGEAPAPLIRLEEPLAGAVTGEKDVTVVGYVTVPAKVNVGDEENVSVISGRFKTVVKLEAPGKAEIVIEAIADGFTSRLTRTVLFDTAAPKLEAEARLAEKDGIWVLSVTGTCQDDVGVKAVSVNDEVIETRPDGSFTFERKGTPALAHAFTEVVAVDEAGRATRMLAWPSVEPTRSAAVAPLIENAKAALGENRTDEAEDVLRDIRDRGGLIEALPPDEVVKLAYGKRAPRITIDPPPEYFQNDGKNTVTVSGKVELFAEGDKLQVGGETVDVVDGRFEAKVPAEHIGRNAIAVQVDRNGKAFSKTEAIVRLAGRDGKVPEWTKRAVLEAQRRTSALSGLEIGFEDKHGMRFVLIPPGSFYRESSDGERFEVRITKPYYMQVREVSREIYERLTGASLPKAYKTKSGLLLPIDGPTRPATGLTRGAVEAFARQISGTEGKYRLPSEAEWEYAARGGDVSLVNYWDDDLSQIAQWANYGDKSILSRIKGWPERLRHDRDDGSPGTWPVGRGKANAFGLRDMLGNAFEWTADYWAEDYDTYEQDDPRGPPAGTEAVVRGGAFVSAPNAKGVSARFNMPLDEAPRATGFRFVFVPEGR